MYVYVVLCSFSGCGRLSGVSVLMCCSGIITVLVPALLFMWGQVLLFQYWY